jgi:hypothetical protein
VYRLRIEPSTSGTQVYGVSATPACSLLAASAANKHDGSVFSFSFPTEATAYVMKIHPEKFVGTVLAYASTCKTYGLA